MEFVKSEIRILNYNGDKNGNKNENKNKIGNRIIEINVEVQKYKNDYAIRSGHKNRNSTI